jgi:hypothetical protein
MDPIPGSTGTTTIGTTATIRMTGTTVTIAMATTTGGTAGATETATVTTDISSCRDRAWHSTGCRASRGSETILQSDKFPILPFPKNLTILHA